jgi:putative ABC transport system permease protein
MIVNEVFGIPMATLVVVLVGFLALCLLSVAWVAWRRPVIFKLGVRNIPRRKAQTLLIVAGLMLSTLIISAALGTGDTLNYSTTNEVYGLTGQVDEVVVHSQSVEGESATALSSHITEDDLTLVESALAGNENVDGVMPILLENVPALNVTRQQAEPSVGLVGIDPARLDQFGGLTARDGGTIDLARLPVTGIVINELAADKLEAVVGDEIVIYYGNTPTTLTVAAIAETSILSGSVDFGQAGLVLPLDTLQRLTGQPGVLSAIAISNTGGVRDAEGATNAVVTTLETALAGQQLGVDPIKRDSVDEAEQISSLFTSLFLVLGLFSIAAGILLIVLIFTMLAAERRAEMGMARAVGAQRRQLVQQFIAEGAGYALIAGLIGSALGVAASFGMGYGMKAIFGDAITITPHVEPRSMIAAYALGVIITFLAVVVSSWKISRLNIVAAVRDIPDVTTSRRQKRSLVWGALLLIVGGVLTSSGLSAEQAFPFFAGMSLIPFGLTLIVRFFGAPNRPVFTLAGLYLLVLWLLPEDLGNQIWGKLDGDMEMFFLSGIFMVVGATIMIVQNLDILLRGVSLLGRLFASKLPAVRTAIAYPGTARGRTGMTIAMFSLIIFSLVTIATMNQNYTALFLGDEANAGWQVRADQMGANPVDDVTGTLESRGVDTSGIVATGIVTTPNPYAARLRMPGTTEWEPYEVRGMNDGFITESDLAFGQRAAGYDTDADVIAALRNTPNVAVIDEFAITAANAMGHGDAPFQLTGLDTDTQGFAPISVEIANPATGEPVQVTIIGIIDSSISSLTGLYANQTTIDAIYPTIAQTSYFIALDDAADPDAMASKIEAALLVNGVQAVSIRSELEDNQKQSTSFLYIVQGFMGLGLIVGIAAVGVIAFRSVVERRQQIGVLRAIGFQDGMVSLSFLIETAFVVGLGIFSGTALGLVLSRSLFISDESASGTAFTIPWALISGMLLATITVALLMAWIPSRQAARIAPAEALRYE